MDRKAIIILVVSFTLMIGWSVLVNRIYPPQPMPPETNRLAHATNLTGSNTNLSTTAATSSDVSASAPTTGTLVESKEPEKLFPVENDSVRLTFTSHGGGLKLVELKKYPESVACRNGNGVSTNKFATLNTKAPVPAFALVGSEALQSDGNFILTKIDNGVRAEKTLSSGARLVKEFELGTNYMMSVIVRLENPTAQQLQLPAQELVIGTATPLGPSDDATLMALQWYDGVNAQSVSEPWFANRTLGCFPGTPRTNYLAGTSNVVWAAVYNRFFTMIVAPPTNTPAPQVVARHIYLPPPSTEELAANRHTVAKPFGFQSAFVYPAMTLAPKQTVERRFDVFAGPKEYKTLDRLASLLGNNMDLVMGFGGFFGFFARLLLLSMNGLYALGLPYALTIIVITIIIKVLFWPLTQMSTRSMKRMQALQPQVKGIQEKYKGDPQKINQKMMELWKQNKVNPAAGCLPMFIQLPIFFGFYRMLQSAIELRGAHFLWACDLSQADTVWIIPALNFPLNPLPLIMGATQVWQMRLTPPSPGVDPVQQKMMQYMPLIFLFILYNFSSGLTLYWTVQNLLTIAQMKLTKSSSATVSTPSKPASPPPRRKK
ncbi:MAG TPA: membrane protein insertase YidC [Desulfuromonadaceae bacterium]|nr:membrane protein insertase YidC [Desulfuromonadaceae bacterium]